MGCGCAGSTPRQVAAGAPASTGAAAASAQPPSTAGDDYFWNGPPRADQAPQAPAEPPAVETPVG